jgi:hypothetical protein
MAEKARRISPLFSDIRCNIPQHLLIDAKPASCLTNAGNTVLSRRH